MNKTRRNKLNKIIDVLNNIVVELEDASSSLEMISNDEQDAFDNLPEGLQCSYKGCDMEDNASELSDQASELNSIVDSLNDIISNIEDIIDR